MKLEEMHEIMKKRYEVDAEAARKAKEELARKDADDKEKLKGLIYELIRIIRYEMENNLQEQIYQKYWELRQMHPTLKRIKADLICEIDEYSACMSVRVNGYRNYWSKDDSPVDLTPISNCEAAKQFFQYMTDHYKAEKDTTEIGFGFSLDENTVTITWFFEGATYAFKDDLKRIMPDGSVHHIRGKVQVILMLD